LREPSGIIDASSAQYEQYDERKVLVRNSKFIPVEKYTIKLEGVEMLGYRSICIGATRDPILIANIDEYIDIVQNNVTDALKATFGNSLSKNDYAIKFHIYGKNGVMGEREPKPFPTGHELCILIVVVAKTQKLANTILGLARVYLLHSPVPGGSGGPK
jgi:hypothetical protein